MRRGAGDGGRRREATETNMEDRMIAFNTRERTHSTKKSQISYLSYPITPSTSLYHQTTTTRTPSSTPSPHNQTPSSHLTTNPPQTNSSRTSSPPPKPAPTSCPSLPSCRRDKRTSTSGCRTQTAPSESSSRSSRGPTGGSSTGRTRR